MTIEIIEGRLKFIFPEDTLACKYDEWSFYRNQFNNVCGGSKALDILHIDAQKTAWLIEIKDYRANARTKPSELGEEIAFKVRDTLASLVAASFNANNSIEKNFAKKLLKAKRLRVVLHLEQPQKSNPLFPKIIDPAHLKLRLNQLLKAIDAHPEVVDQASLKPNMHWQAIDHYT